jgi:hypothetical protein
MTPMTLSAASNDAWDVARNVAGIEALVDHDPTRSGAAVSGVPWQHIDHGHGYCADDLFEQCAHRMACA